MSEYSASIATAKRLIKKKGRTIQLRTISKSGPSYNPVENPSDKPVKAVEVEATKMERDRGLIQEDSRVYLIDSEHEITAKMKVFDDVELSIKKIMPFRPGSEIVFYRVIVNG